MSLFRNQEMVCQAGIFAVLWCAGLVGVVFFPSFAVLIWCVSGFLSAIVWYLQNERRYCSVRKLTMELDEILHGNMELEIGSFKEGDMEILRDEIYKMTIFLREQAEQSMKGKKELADSLADISHQIKTPLTTLNLLTERLKRRNLAEWERQKLLQETKQMLERIEHLITVILKLSRLDAGAVNLDRREVSVQKLVQKAMEPLEIAMEVREQKCTVRGNENSTVIVDEMWTVEAIGNLLKNAIEYTPDQGEILVEWKENALYTSLEIFDGGKGFAREDLPHLFERFYKGKNAKGNGFGIGLALAKAIFVKQNAAVKAENQKGGGCFQVLFYKGNL